MHVLVTCDAVGGVWTYTRELVSGLVRRGHQVALVSFGMRPEKNQLSWMHKVSDLKYYATDFPLEWMQDSAAGIAASMEYLKQLIERIKPDVVHSNQYCYGAVKCSVPRIVVAHSDVVGWWEGVHESPPPESPWLLWYRNVVAVGLVNADVLVAPSHWMLNSLRKHYPPSSHTTVLYNGRDASLFSSSKNKTNCVLSVGRLWDEGKQISLLLDRQQSGPVYVAGSLQNPNEKNDTALPATRENVVMLGALSEKALCEVYSTSSIYAMTSRYEPFGLAPVEAALSRCALVANDIPIFRELWGDSAIYFRRNDPDALADAIRTLRENSEMRDEYAQRAWQRARECFDSQRMVSQYEALYSQVTSRGAAA